MNKLLNTFKINDDYLINFEGQKFNKIVYESEFHSDLAFKLQDPELARDIYSAYAAHIRDTLSESEQKIFENALLRICLLFGSQKYPPNLGLRLALEENQFPFQNWMQSHNAALNQFMHEANQIRFAKSSAPRVDDKIHVVITTTSAAGGNLSVAKGLASELELSGRFRVTVIDVEELANEFDPLIIATGTHTFEKVYAEIVQKDNNLNDGFDIRLNHYRKVARYIEPIVGKILKERIYALQPDFILSTRNCDPIDISLPLALDTPGCVLHCDNEVGYFYNDLVGKIQAQLVKLWFPDCQNRVFKPVLDRTNVSWEKNKDSTWDKFREVLANAVKLNADEVEEQMEFVGFATRPEIYEINDPDKIQALREKWNLQPGDICIPVIMGQNGVGKMKDIFDELLTSTHTMPIKYVFVSGQNETMRSYMEEHALPNQMIKGEISASEVNELLNIGLFMIGKPGGSQKEECRVTKTPMMIAFCHGYWESGNLEQLQEEGYALSYNPDESLAAQVENHVRELSDKKLPDIARRDWKKIIPEAILKAL